MVLCKGCRCCAGVLETYIKLVTVVCKVLECYWKPGNVTEALFVALWFVQENAVLGGVVRSLVVLMHLDTS